MNIIATKDGIQFSIGEQYIEAYKELGYEISVQVVCPLTDEDLQNIKEAQPVIVAASIEPTTAPTELSDSLKAIPVDTQTIGIEVNDVIENKAESTVYTLQVGETNEVQ